MSEEAMKALRRARDKAVHYTLAARIPECGEFGAISQDLDYAIDAIAADKAEIALASDELRRLIESIWQAEYRQDAPDWKPLPDLIGMITQMDNMYAGVRSQRDQARWDLAEARKALETPHAG